MNATLSPDGYLSLFIQSSIDIERLFLTVVIKFGTADSDFNIEFMNRTVEICKFQRNPRYEPLLQLFYKILSEKMQLPQRCPVKKVSSGAEWRLGFLFVNLLIFSEWTFLHGELHVWNGEASAGLTTVSKTILVCKDFQINRRHSVKSAWPDLYWTCEIYKLINPKKKYICSRWLKSRSKSFLFMYPEWLSLNEMCKKSELAEIRHL